MKFLLEGVDGCGKTTLAKKIQETFSGIDFEMIHCTRETSNNYEFFLDMLMSDKHMIIDRGYLGQFIYQTEEERISNGWLTNKELRLIDRVASIMNVIKIYVTANTDLCLYNCKHNGEDGHYTAEYINNLKSKYVEYLDDLNGWTFYENNFEHPEFAKNFDYSSLPKIVCVDFDGTLNLTDKPFPSIGKPFMPLLSELTEGKYKDYKKILYTTRSGKALDDAVKICEEWGLKLDAVNDNIDELKQHGLNPRKIYCNAIIDDLAIHPREFREFAVRP